MSSKVVVALLLAVTMGGCAGLQQRGLEQYQPGGSQYRSTPQGWVDAYGPPDDWYEFRSGYWTYRVQTWSCVTPQRLYISGTWRKVYFGDKVVYHLEDYSKGSGICN